MIRRARYILAAAGSAAILAGGMSLAGAGAASAAALPSCATSVNCTSSSAGSAGYYGADDNHTHYRYVQTVTTAEPQLVNLNGNGNVTGRQGSVGVELCDPNIGFAAQLSLGFVGAPATGTYEVRYRVGFFTLPAADPCIQNGFVNFAFASGQVLTPLNGIKAGDQVFLAIYYTPGGGHFHQLSFGVCDLKSQVCRQAYTGSKYNLNFWEFGIGGLANSVTLTAPANNFLDTFTDNAVTCYSCSGPVPITKVSPVNPFNIGGLYENQFVNVSSQTQMSPNDGLSPSTAAFTLYSGSTSP